MTTPLPNTFRNVVHAFGEFLTIAIHCILYEREIYPRTSFISARRYNVAVRQSRHPKVCEWINDAVGSVDAQLLKGAVERVAVVIYSRTNEALERFVFDVSQLPDIAEDDLDVVMVRQEDGDEDDEQEEEDEAEDAGLLPVVDMEEQFRAVISTISNCPAMLRPLPKNCTFTVAIELRKDDGHHAPLSHPQAWVPAHVQSGKSADTEQDQTRQPPKTTSLRTMAAGELKFEAWVEECAVREQPAAVSVTTGSARSKLPSAEG